MEEIIYYKLDKGRNNGEIDWYSLPEKTKQTFISSSCERKRYSPKNKLEIKKLEDTFEKAIYLKVNEVGFLLKTEEARSKTSNPFIVNKEGKIKGIFDKGLNVEQVLDTILMKKEKEEIIIFKENSLYENSNSISQDVVKNKTFNG